MDFVRALDLSMAYRKTKTKPIYGQPANLYQHLLENCCKNRKFEHAASLTTSISAFIPGLDSNLLHFVEILVVLGVKFKLPHLKTFCHVTDFLDNCSAYFFFYIYKYNSLMLVSKW